MKPAALACLVAVVTGLALLAVPGARAAAQTLEARIMVMPTEGDAPEVARLSDATTEALRATAARFTTQVAVATAALADTAVIVGCDPAELACLDAVAAALNVDRLLFARLSPGEPGAARVEVTLSSREHAAIHATYVVRAASRDADLAAMQDGVAGLFEQEVEPVTPPDASPPDAGPGAGPGAGGAPPDGTPLPPPPPPRARARWPLWLAAGGVGAVAVGGVMWALAARKQGEIDDAPAGTARELEALADLEASARWRAGAGNVLVIGGAVAAAAGAGLYWLRGGAERGPSVGAAPVAGGAALTLGGAW